MNREIKFRVWDGVDFMSKPFTLQDLQLRKIVFAGDTTVMQFTGLKDKNGKEIFEGDIFKYSLLGAERSSEETEYIEEVKFEGGSFDLDATYLGAFHEDGEVIGNIHQNPELLK
jgi:uncharacterized phage protein (TIGR01671 family)